MLRAIALLICVLGCSALFRVDPLVETKLGLVRGLKTSDGYSKFLGVPYARVDESNVFGPSIPLTKYDTTFEAFDDSVICPQFDIFTNAVSGNLDCLTLNIYVPDSASTANPLPVMVWIHGGAFVGGSAISSHNGPGYLVRHDVILVTVQYRLGPYGFLCLDTSEVPGNQGLKDQLAALRWVRDNIGAFGGDANSVTLFGTSAGGMSIDLHLQSDQELLFSRAIMQSGASTTPRVTKESDTTVPMQLSAQLGFVTEDLNEALAFLSKAEVELVIAAGNELGIEWRTCPEKDFEGVEKFVTDFPINKNVTKARSVAILSGYNSFELGMYSTMNLNFESDIFARNLELIFDFGEEFLDMEQVVKHFYIGDQSPEWDVSSSIAEFLSDFTYGYPVQWTIEKYLRNGVRNIYHYIFSYPGDKGYANHGDEHKYLFDTGSELSDDEELLRDRMTMMWTNFAKYGDPTPSTSELLPLKWTPATADTLTYLDINTAMFISTRPFRNRMAFWDLYFKVNWQKLRGYRAV